MFPNVVAAEQDEEKTALDTRYKKALADADARGARTAVDTFEAAVAESKVVINQRPPEVERLATSTDEVYGTFYRIVNAGLRLPRGDKWNRIRPLVDAALFPYYKEEIRFGVLSLSAKGPRQYGLCSMVLKTELIEYRTSLLEENSILFFAHQGIRVSDVDQLPSGYRSIWAERGRLAVAKLANRIDASPSAGGHAALLLHDDGTPEGTDFVEAHVYGPMTMRTVERVTVPAALTRAERRMLPGLREQLKALAIPMERA